MTTATILLTGLLHGATVSAGVGSTEVDGASQTRPSQRTGAPAYPVTSTLVPCTRASCDGVDLVGLTVGVGGGDAPESDLGARVQVLDRAFVGARVSRDTRAFQVTTRRLDLGVDHTDGRLGFRGGYRASRLLVEARSRRDADFDGGGWRHEVDAALRMGPDLEFLVGGSQATAVEAGLSATSERQRRQLSGGLLWQRGLELELHAQASTTRIDDGLGEFSRDRIGTDLSYLWRGTVEVTSELAYQRDRGVIPSSFRVTGVAAAVEVLPHLVARGRYRTRAAVDLGLRSDETMGWGATLYTREHRFDREGDAARRTLDLARRATALGFNERRVHTIDGRRALRERLSLSPELGELTAAAEALYLAQEQDRNVGHVGFDWRRRQERLTGSIERTVELFVGMPWPLRRPFTRDATAVDFLQFRLTRVARSFTQATQHEHHYEGVVALNRETHLLVRWIDAEPSRLQDALGLTTPVKWDVRLDVRIGR